MADRIFPSAEKDSLGSAKQINTIDWAKFAQTLNIKLAADEDTKPEGTKPEDDEDEDAEEAPESAEEEEEEEEEENGEENGEGKKATAGNLDKLKGGLKEFMKNKMKKNAPKANAKEDDDAEPMKRKAKECEACGKAYSGAKCGCTAKTAGKIVFNSPEEISAEALMQAKTAGNEQLVRAILAAREDRYSSTPRV